MQSQMVVSKVGSSVTTELKIKRVINKQELWDVLDKLRIELTNSRSQQKFLENQLFEKKKDEGLSKPVVEREG